MKKLLGLVAAWIVLTLLCCAWTMALHNQAHAQIATTTIPIVNVGSDVANNAATATLPATANKTTYICGFVVTGLGATAGLNTTMTITGLAQGSYAQDVGIPAGVLVPMFFQMLFDECLPASAPNTTIGLSNSAFGSGNTHAQVTAFGFQQ